MEGHISENPLAELIREISVKRLSGRLRVQQERVALVVYFTNGELVYAASNIRTLRLREYLIKDRLVSEEVLSRFDSNRSDISLAKQLTGEGLVDEKQAARAQFRQVTDVLRLGLLWTEGKWEFDSRSHLSEEVPFKFEWESLLLDAGRRFPFTFAASRLANSNEIISTAANLQQRSDLQPTEGFLLSRLDQPTSISDLTLLSGLPEAETLRMIYALALSGLIQRQQWKQAFRGETQPRTVSVPVAATETTPDLQAQTTDPEADSLQRFLERVDRASTPYQVLDVTNTATPADIKKCYYEVARRYHPDRFRKDNDAALNARIETAFARVTQAYEILREPGSRATYDSKLDAQQRAQAIGNTAPKTTSGTPTPATSGSPSEPQPKKPSNGPLTHTERAEQHFKEGFAAKQMGQVNTAIGLFSAASRLAPNDARYRAYYGNALAALPNTRRLAEAELQAAVKIEPENADYRVMLSELYRDLGFAVRARSEIEKILKKSPGHLRGRELLRSL